MKDKKHLYWVIGFVLITLMICGTVVWINYNSWTIRFEMDDNMRASIESIDWDEINGMNEIEEDYFVEDFNASLFEDNLTFNSRLIPESKGLIFNADYVNFTDGNFTITFGDSIYFNLNEVNYMEWNIGNGSWRFNKE